MEAELVEILKRSLIFRDIKEVDPSYYKNVEYKVNLAMKNREDKVDIKCRAIAKLVVNKIVYGSTYTEKTENYLSTVIFPLLNK